MSLTITNASAINRVSLVMADTDYVVIYDGSAPANANASLSGNNALVTISYNTPPYDTPTMVGDNAVAAINDSPANPSGVVALGGTASFYRQFNASNNVLRQGTVTATGGGGQLELESTTLLVGDLVEIT